MGAKKSKRVRQTRSRGRVRDRQPRHSDASALIETSGGALSAEQRGEILWLTLNRQDHGQSWGLKESQRLEALLNEANQTPARRMIRGLVLTSASAQVFCGGGDLKAYAAHRSPSEGCRVNRSIARSLQSLAGAPFPTLALVSGDCWGGGVELLSSFDHIIAAPHVFFGLWQRRLGVSLGWESHDRLAARLGSHRLVEAVLSTRSFGAQEALKMGLVDEIAPISQLADRAQAWLDLVLAGGGMAAFSPIKAAVDQSGIEGLSRVTRKLWGKPEHQAQLQKALRRNRR